MNQYIVLYNSFVCIRKGNLMDKNANSIMDFNGRKIVVVKDIKFQSRRRIDWKEIEEYLKEYIGECFEGKIWMVSI